MSMNKLVNKDFSDGMRDGEQLAKFVILSKLKQIKKHTAPNSSGGRVVKELEDYIGKPFNLIVCVKPKDENSKN